MIEFEDKTTTELRKLWAVILRLYFITLEGGRSNVLLIVCIRVNMFIIICDGGGGGGIVVVLMVIVVVIAVMVIEGRKPWWC